jgi:hypothetical protein
MTLDVYAVLFDQAGQAEQTGDGCIKNWNQWISQHPGFVTISTTEAVDMVMQDNGCIFDIPYGSRFAHRNTRSWSDCLDVDRPANVG